MTKETKKSAATFGALKNILVPVGTGVIGAGVATLTTWLVMKPKKA